MKQELAFLEQLCTDASGLEKTEKVEAAPATVELLDDAPLTLRRHTGEILQRLKAGGIIAEDIAAVFPGSVDITAAVIWLRERLTSPQHIAVVVAEWVGPLERPTGKDVDDLMAARWVLGVVAFVGADGRCWWRLPVKTVH